MTQSNVGSLKLKPPFPWFGGKGHLAAKIWSCLGDVSNYIEPFAGGLAVLLSRPTPPKVETVNDIDGLIVNFWRSVKFQPEEVAEWADWPVHELNLAAHKKSLAALDYSGLRASLTEDFDFCDPKLAGIWCWAQCVSIGGIQRRNLPHLGNPGRGVHRTQLPHLGDPGTGVHRTQLPYLSRDVPWRTTSKVHNYIQDLCQRLRRVRVCCGDWSRVLTPSVSTRHGLTGVFLDPPYPGFEDSYDNYGMDHGKLVAWAQKAGQSPLFRIALCGHIGDYDLPGWKIERVKRNRGYSFDNEHRFRDCVWFSPHCLHQLGLFE